MNAVQDGGNAHSPGGRPAENAAFGTVGVNHIRPELFHFFKGFSAVGCFTDYFYVGSQRNLCTATKCDAVYGSDDRLIDVVVGYACETPLARLFFRPEFACCDGFQVRTDAKRLRT